MRLISIVTPTFNDAGNILMFQMVVEKSIPKGYDWEHIFIDDASTDLTPDFLRLVAGDHPQHVKLIFNSRRYGSCRTPMHVFLQAKGDAVIAINSDMQDPPEMIPQFIEKWEKGAKIVIGVREEDEKWSSTLYYRFLSKLSKYPVIRGFVGFGLYDREVVERMRSLNETYPYFRGRVLQFGYPFSIIFYKREKRYSGKSHSTIWIKLGIAFLGVITQRGRKFPWGSPVVEKERINF